MLKEWFENSFDKRKRINLFYEIEYVNTRKLLEYYINQSTVFHVEHNLEYASEIKSNKN